MATARKTAAKKPAPAPEPEELDDDFDLGVEDDELEELDEAEVAEAAPKKKGRKVSDEVTFGAAQLAALLTEKGDKTITPRDLRTLLRKMARDGRLDREITPGNRTRYNWSGPNDPEVKAIIKAVLGGELEAGKREALQKLKDQKAAKQAAKAKVKAAQKKAEELEELED